MWEVLPFNDSADLESLSLLYVFFISSTPSGQQSVESKGSEVHAERCSSAAASVSLVYCRPVESRKRFLKREPLMPRPGQGLRLSPIIGGFSRYSRSRRRWGLHRFPPTVSL